MSQEFLKGFLDKTGLSSIDLGSYIFRDAEADAQIRQKEAIEQQAKIKQEEKGKKQLYTNQDGSLGLTFGDRINQVFSALGGAQVGQDNLQQAFDRKTRESKVKQIISDNPTIDYSGIDRSDYDAVNNFTDLQTKIRQARSEGYNVDGIDSVAGLNKLKIDTDNERARQKPEFQLRKDLNEAQILSAEASAKASEAAAQTARGRLTLDGQRLQADVQSKNEDRRLQASQFNRNYTLQLQQAQSQAEYNTAQLQAQIEQSRLLNEQANLDRDRLNESDEREYRFRLKELEQRRFDDIFNALGNLQLY